MNHAVHSIKATNNQPLHYQSWRPEGALRGVMLVVHGAAEHGGRYAEFAAQLNGSGFAVATIDLPGHGLSPGKRCCVGDFDEYLEAVERAHEYAEREFSSDIGSVGADAAEVAQSVPFFLVGHSMGGLVASLYVQLHQARFCGAIFSGAALLAEPAPGKVQAAILRMLAKLSPSLGVLQLDASSVSRDTAVVSKYVNDPLVHSGKLTASMLVAMFAAMKRSYEGLPLISLPVLIMHGDKDRLVAPSASQLLFERVSSSDKTLRLLPGLYHEIFNEPERVEIVDELIAWAGKRLPGTA